jgi:hypothetical protein
MISSKTPSPSAARLSDLSYFVFIFIIPIKCFVIDKIGIIFVTFLMLFSAKNLQFFKKDRILSER